MKVELSNKTVPWITPDGYLDPAKFPIGGILQQAMAADTRTFESAVRMLQMMYGGGRNEAGVFLLGLLVASGDDWDRRLTLAEALRDVRTEACARLLFGELRRTKSSNTTRRYLNAVIKTLAALPAELVHEEFASLAYDKSFSEKFRRKFRAVIGDDLDSLSDWP